MALIVLAALQTAPADLYEAAKLDGAGLWQRFVAVTWPVVAPPLLFTSNTSAKTLTVAIADFAAGRATGFDLVSAAGLVTAVPLIAFVLQKSLTGGLTAGGVKG